jgi:hypothetical protein
MRSKIVYRAEPALAQQALTVLRRSGVPAELLNEPSPVVRQKSWFSARVEVAVPEPEAARAREVLQNWAAESDRAVAPPSRSVGWGLVLVFGPPLTGIAVTSAPNMEGPDWLFKASLAWAVLAAAAIAYFPRRSARPNKRG